MSVLDKVSSTPNICEIALDFLGSAIPLNSFYSSITANSIFEDIHFQKGSVQFSEESKQVAAGIKYEQTLSITFNSNDKHRSERLSVFHNVRFIKIKLTNGDEFLIGRNDFFQNRKPIVSTSSNLKKSTVEFYSESIIPVSKYLGTMIIGLPEIIPLNFNTSV